MAMNRRNVLIGLGAIAAGGGAAFGSGAFSQVEAERSVSIATASDTSANVQFAVDDSSSAISTPSGDTISIDGDGLNLEAVTEVSQVITITPTGSGPFNVDILDDFGSSSVTLADGSEDTTASGEDIQLVANNSASNGTADGSGGFTDVAAGDSVVYDIVFNLRDDSSTGDSTIPFTNNSIVVQVN